MMPLSTASDQCWHTPRYVYDYACSQWGEHVIDVAAESDEVSMCARHVEPGDRSIYEPPPIEAWEHGWWCNPPWRATREWVQSALLAFARGRHGTLLLRADLSTRSGYDLSQCAHVEVIVPRVHYLRGGSWTSAPCGSMLAHLGDAPIGVSVIRLEPRHE